MSTPNRLTFSPGRDTPINPFHTRELNAGELTELLESARFRLESMAGVVHGRGPSALDAKSAGPICEATGARPGPRTQRPPDASRAG